MSILRTSLLLFLVSFTLASSVLEVDETTYAEFMAQKPRPGLLLELSAPWCGKCKDLAPKYERVATAFKRYRETPVVLARLDADSFRDIADNFDIKTYPKIVWFSPDSADYEEYTGEHDEHAILEFVNAKSGLRASLKHPLTDAITLTDVTFDSIVMDPTKDVLVYFHAPWCGHCKLLNPIFKEVASAFADEEHVVIAKLDGDMYRQFEDKYRVTGFPTIKFFPRDAKTGEGEGYVEGRDLEGLVEFLNKRCGTQRTVIGGLLPEASQTEELNALAHKFMNSKKDRWEGILKQTKAVTDERGPAYAKVMQNIISKGLKYLVKEEERLETMLTYDNLSAKQVTLLSDRLNVLNAFVDAVTVIHH